MNATSKIKCSITPILLLTEKWEKFSLGLRFHQSIIFKKLTGGRNNALTSVRFQSNLRVSRHAEQRNYFFIWKTTFLGCSIVKLPRHIFQCVDLTQLKLSLYQIPK